MNSRLMLYSVLAMVVAIAISLVYIFSPLHTYMRSISQSTTTEPVSTPEKAWACNADGKICPDGSLVGRTGPNCEFTECPAADAKSASLTTYLGGSPTALNVTVSPQQVVSDSRCPAGVQCIWAGTVDVRTVLSTQVSHGEHIMKLNEPQIFGDYTVTLTAVTPYPTADQEIPGSSYRFTYEIVRN